jgi:hypothetical protein
MARFSGISPCIGRNYRNPEKQQMSAGALEENASARIDFLMIWLFQKTAHPERDGPFYKF